jgi:16S rRNA (guanine966-N2)-methyltransferase
MTAIIAGRYKRKKLYNFNNICVRPTQAKVRKSIFQILEPFDDLDILDLYAGIGTLGFEALSRGAKNVVFIEKDRQVFKILKKNSSLFDNDGVKLLSCDVIQYLSTESNKKFDMVFADPPYQSTDFFILLEKVKKLLKPNGIFCMEMKKEKMENLNVRIKYYGNTQVIFWKAS